MLLMLLMLPTRIATDGETPDISMPVMDGIESSSKMREFEEETSRPRTAIMAVTGVASSEMQQQAFAAGIDDYLVKPLSLHDLKRIMNIA